MFSLTFDRDGDGDADLLVAPNVLSTGYPPQTASVVDNAGGWCSRTSPISALHWLPRADFRAPAADADGDGDEDLVLSADATTARGSTGTMDYFRTRGGGLRRRSRRQPRDLGPRGRH
jgi:hypothetical protein